MSANTALAPSIAELEERVARADLARFLAACYYEPGPEFAEERLFDSMAAAAERVDPDLARRARRLGEAFSAVPLETLLVDYTRLFLGTSGLATKPYESEWKSARGPALQDSTMALLSLYAEGGFEMDEAFRELPDHIAAELEFLYLLSYQDAAPTLRARFLREHLGVWAQPFTEAVQAAAGTAFYRELAQLTGRIVGMEAARAA